MLESINFTEIAGLTYGGMFALALTANMVVPVPEEIVLLLVGYFTATGHFNFLYSYAIFAIGMFISDTALYFMAYKGARITRTLRRKVENNRHLRDEGFVKRHIKKIIIMSRFLMYLRWIGPVLSGVAKVRYKTFAFYNAIALLMYVPLVLWLGHYFQNYIGNIISDVNRVRNVFLFIFSIIILSILAKLINKKFIRTITETIDEYTPTWIPGLSIKKRKIQKELKKQKENRD
jgi:membrane protein DedA with SNARE-associated domain